MKSACDVVVLWHGAQATFVASGQTAHPLWNGSMPGAHLRRGCEFFAPFGFCRCCAWTPCQVIQLIKLVQLVVGEGSARPAWNWWMSN
jgi:hypothetical protein